MIAGHLPGRSSCPLLIGGQTESPSRRLKSSSGRWKDQREMKGIFLLLTELFSVVYWRWCVVTFVFWVCRCIRRGRYFWPVTRDVAEEGAICNQFWGKASGNSQLIKDGSSHEAFPSWVSSFTPSTTHLEAVPSAHNCWEMRSTSETVFIIHYLLPLSTYLTVHVGLKLLKLLPAVALHSENQ